MRIFFILILILYKRKIRLIYKFLMLMIPFLTTTIYYSHQQPLPYSSSPLKEQTALFSSFNQPILEAIGLFYICKIIYDIVSFSHMITHFLSSKTRGDQNIQRVWKLKGPHRLNLMHQKIGDDIKYFLKIHREAKKGMVQSKLLSIFNQLVRIILLNYLSLKKGVDGLEMRNT